MRLWSCVCPCSVDNVLTRTYLSRAQVRRQSGVRCTTRRGRDVDSRQLVRAAALQIVPPDDLHGGLRSTGSRPLQLQAVEPPHIPQRSPTERRSPPPSRAGRMGEDRRRNLAGKNTDLRLRRVLRAQGSAPSSLSPPRYAAAAGTVDVLVKLCRRWALLPSGGVAEASEGRRLDLPLSHTAGTSVMRRYPRSTPRRRRARHRPSTHRGSEGTAQGYRRRQSPTATGLPGCLVRARLRRPLG
jgi:hypothetical protein